MELESRAKPGKASGPTLSCPLSVQSSPVSEATALLTAAGEVGTDSRFDSPHVLLSRCFILKNSGASGESRGETASRERCQR